MKTTVTLISLLITLSSFAFETYEPPKCSRDTCILSPDHEIGFHDYYDREGELQLILNTSSSLLDIPFKKYCFRGNDTEVKDILHSLAGNTNAYYPQGGHFYINGLSFEKKAPHTDDMKITVAYESDYDLHEVIEVILLKKCN